MTPKEMAIEAAKALDSKRGKDIRAMEVTDLTSLADYFVICTGGSNTQISAWWSTCLTRRPASSILWNGCGATEGPWT